MKFVLGVLAFSLLCASAYATEFEPNNTQETAQSILLAEAISGNLSTADDKDYFELYLQEPQKLDLSFSAVDGNFPNGVGYQVAIHDGHEYVHGSMICDQAIRCNVDGIRFSVFLRDAGSYFVRVESSAIDSYPEGQYSLIVDQSSEESLAEEEPNDTDDQSQSLSVGLPVRGHLSGPFDADVFSFELEGRNVVEIDMIGGDQLSISEYGYRLELKTPDGTLIASRTCDRNSNCDAEKVTLTAGVQGKVRYLLFVMSTHPEAVPRGEYELLLRITDQDYDRILDVNDNCPNEANFDQLDSDFDGYGDVCDPNPLVNSTYDVDGDGEIRAFTDAFFVGGSGYAFPYTQDFTRFITGNGSRKTIEEINAYISSLPSGSFDFDLDGSQSIAGNNRAASDLLQLMLHQLGLTTRVCENISAGGERSCEQVVEYLDGVAPTPKIKAEESVEEYLEATVSAPQPFDDQFSISFNVQGSTDLFGWAIKLFYNSEEISTLDIQESSLPSYFFGGQVYWSTEMDIHDLDDNPETDSYFAYTAFKLSKSFALMDGGDVVELVFNYPDDTAGFVYPYVTDLTAPYGTRSIEPISLKFLDSDEDGTIDVEDAFPFDPNETLDTDGDGTGNNEDEDDDGDGVNDDDDALPLNSAETLDFDQDGLGDNEDPDDDNDSVPDVVDFYPYDSTRVEYCCQKALIVAGGGPYFGNALWPATKNMANFAYQTLKFQGLDDEDILYLSAEDLDIVDGFPTEDAVKNAVINLADSSDVAVDDVLIYMVDHGGDGVFKLDETNLLHATDLKEWMDQLHQTFEGRSTLIYDACESGSFVPILAQDDESERLVITSSAPKQPAVFALNGFSSFSYVFWSSFYVGFEISESQLLADRAMNLIWRQTPNFDADGDGLPNTKNDKRVIEKFRFGQRAAKASDNPIIGNISVATELNGETSVLIEVDQVTGGTGLSKVRVFVDDPDYLLPIPDEPVLEANSFELSPNSNGSWTGLLTGFDIAGDYDLTVIAENKGGLFSIPDETDSVTITQLVGRDPVIEVLADSDGDGISDHIDFDDDEDGVADLDDAFPLDKDESVDTDGDGVGNNADSDDDGDDVSDDLDAFPLDKDESIDTDGDGVGNNADSDDDDDDVSDDLDAFPLDKDESVDTDGDGVGNNADSDDDDDDVSDDLDAFPLDKDESVDTDGDGVGNNADSDDDGDGLLDEADAFPTISLGGRTDTDSDGYPDDCDALCEDSGMTADADDDNDNVIDSEDAFPLDVSESKDSDGDGVGDNADVFPGDASESKDTDSDQIGDNADNCPVLANADQLNTDSDAEGDACDLDDDNDGFSDLEEIADGTNPLSRFSCRSGCFSFDIDQNEEAKALTDGLLVIRHLFGFTGDALATGAIATDADRKVADDISALLSDADSELDIDGNGESKALTDGLLLIRYLFGFTGDALIAGAIGAGATRESSEAIEVYIKDRVPEAD
jgi:hypothetical protein